MSAGFSIELFRCVTSPTYYCSLSEGDRVTKVCSNDPRTYQACGTGQSHIRIFANSWDAKFHYLLCGFDYPRFLISVADKFSYGIEEVGTTVNSSDSIVACNGICDDLWCADELLCNGFQYALRCDIDTSCRMGLKYLSPQFECD